MLDLDHNSQLLMLGISIWYFDNANKWVRCQNSECINIWPLLARSTLTRYLVLFVIFASKAYGWFYSHKPWINIWLFLGTQFRRSVQCSPVGDSWRFRCHWRIDGCWWIKEQVALFRSCCKYLLACSKSSIIRVPLKFELRLSIQVSNYSLDF